MNAPRVSTRLGGLLGAAIAAGRTGRLRSFVADAHSPPIRIFSPEARAGNRTGDWYGEHAGKWLMAAARAGLEDADLLAHVREVADYLLSVQEKSGYLGTYAPSCRFTDRVEVPAEPSWDGAPAMRTWDVWVHSYMILGLLAAAKSCGESRYLEAAARIGDLCLHALADGFDITALGNHHGMSATVLLDPAVALHAATGEPRYLELATRILAQAEANPRLRFLSRALAGVDASEIATGKAYQLLWNMVGVARLYRFSHDERHLAAARNVWQNVRDHHLTLGGGPWGGAGLRSREIFNPPQVFDPCGYVETCSTMAWIELNQVLLELTGDARHAQDIERAACNALLGAVDPNGDDWCYYTFPNGPRRHTTAWRCCKSSGALALELLPELVCTAATAERIAVNLYGEGASTITFPDGQRVLLRQRTNYPAEGPVRLEIEAADGREFSLALRIPDWARETRIELDGVPVDAVATSPGWREIRRHWHSGDVVTLHTVMDPVVHVRTSRSLQEAVLPDGSRTSQEVFRRDFVAVTRGPLVYASGLADGFKSADTVAAIPDPARGELKVTADAEVPGEQRILWQRRGGEPLSLVPWYRAGGRRDGAWRLTWMELSPQAVAGAAPGDRAAGSVPEPARTETSEWSHE